MDKRSETIDNPVPPDTHFRPSELTNFCKPNSMTNVTPKSSTSLTKGCSRSLKSTLMAFLSVLETNEYKAFPHTRYRAVTFT